MRECLKAVPGIIQIQWNGVSLNRNGHGLNDQSTIHEIPAIQDQETNKEISWATDHLPTGTGHQELTTLTHCTHTDADTYNKDLPLYRHPK